MPHFFFAAILYHGYPLGYIPGARKIMATASLSQPSKKPGLLRIILRSHELALLVALVLVASLTSALDAQHNYFAKPTESLVDIIRQWSLLALFAIGASVVIIAGGIDLSAGSVIAFSGTFCATLLLLIAPEAMLKGTPLGVGVISCAIAGTLFAGFLIGTLHTWLITRIGLPPFVATLATLVGLRSLGRAMCEQVMLATAGAKSTQIQIFDKSFRYLATSVWVPAVLALVLGIVVWFLLSKTVLGRHIYALGGNEQAARLSGIQTDRLKWVAYSISAMLSSLAGIIFIAEQSVADPQTLGRGYELNAIAAAVVGGCSLQGGVGTIPGTLLGALFLRLVIDGVAKVIKTGADVYEGLIVGVVVVLAVTLTQLGSRGTRKQPLFEGTLGGITLINLGLLAALLASLVGVRFLPETTHLNGTWLALIVGVVTVSLLAITRQPWAYPIRWGAGIATLIVSIAASYGIDRSIPAWQLSSARSAIKAVGGELLSGEEGDLICDLQNSTLTDEKFLSLAKTLRPLANLAVLRLQNTPISDEVVEAFKPLEGLKEVDVTGTKLTIAGVTRLRRLPQQFEVNY